MNAHGEGFHGPDGPEGEQRRRRLVALLATAEPDTGVTGGDGSAAGRDRARLGRVCAFSVSEAGVSGAGITVMASLEAGRAGARDQVCATGARTGLLEDLQLTTGEGPCLDAYCSGAPVLVGELAGETGRWPGYGPEALAAGTAAVFSLPLQVGAVRLGTLDLNRDTVGPLSAAQLADALELAGLATETLLELAGAANVPGPSPDPDSPVEADQPGDHTGGDDSATRPVDNFGWLPGVHAEVHQASGMVSISAGVGVGDALLRLRAHAFTSGVSITEVARQVIARDLVLEADDQ